MARRARSRVRQPREMALHGEKDHSRRRIREGCVICWHPASSRRPCRRSLLGALQWSLYAARAVDENGLLVQDWMNSGEYPPAKLPFVAWRNFMAAAFR